MKKSDWKDKIEEILRVEIGGYFFEYDEETTKIDDKDPIFSKIYEIISQEISNAEKEIKRRYEKRLRDIKDLNEEYDRKLKKEIKKEMGEELRIPEWNKLSFDSRNKLNVMTSYGVYEELKKTINNYLKTA